MARQVPRALGLIKGVFAIRGFASLLVLFFVNAAMSGSIGPRNAEIARALGLSEGAFGLALLGQAIGLTVVILTLAPRLADRFGARRVGLWSALVYALATALPGVVGDGVQLFAVLLVFGAVNAPLDVAVNQLASALERRYDRILLPYLEVGFNVGLLLAAIGGAWAAGRSSVFEHLGTVAVVGAVLVLVAWRRMPSGVSAEEAQGMARATRSRIVALALIAGAALWSELAIQDWGSLLYLNELGAPITAVGIGVVSFIAGFVVALAITGPLAKRLGRPNVMRFGALLFAAGMLAVALAPDYKFATAALFVAGLGIGPAHPLAISASGELAGRAQAVTIAAGYIGLMAQKPVIGQIASVTSLRFALGATSVALAVAVVLCAGAARRSGPVGTA